MEFVIAALALGACVMAALAWRAAARRQDTQQLEQLREALLREIRAGEDSRKELVRYIAQSQKENTQTLQSGLSAQLMMMTERMQALEGQMARLRQENQTQLDRIRGTVDEQLQTALDKKLRESFESVAAQLARVQKGLGEMQTLAGSVGDLKKVLGNVKTRGILGEVQLGSILEQLLAPEQYAANVVPVPGSRDPVEYAVRLPGEENGTVLLPIDAKFPADCYADLVDAYNSGDSARIETAGRALDQRILRFAKDVSSKYIHVPETTEFAILFLPVEGLYAEVVRRGLIERLQREYHIMIAGPTTMAALLNSLQMGFRTLAIQKRSGEVWQILGSVKTEFGKFEEALTRTQQRLTQASDELEKLVGVRTRAINRRLSGVTELTDGEEKRDAFRIDMM